MVTWTLQSPCGDIKERRLFLTRHTPKQQDTTCYHPLPALCPTPFPLSLKRLHPRSNMHRSSPKANSSIVPYKRHRIDGPRPRQTSPFTWFAAIVCALLWVIIALGGLAVLIVYLIFRPKTPKVEISTATLNAVYVDVGVLNADISILANFSNPNHKIDITYGYMALDLYYNVTMIAAQGIEPFTESRMTSTLRNVRLVASQVELPAIVADELRQIIENGTVISFSIRGKLRIKLTFSRFVQVSYWLYTKCDLVLKPPPSGVLQLCQCSSKR